MTPAQKQAMAHVLDQARSASPRTRERWQALGEKVCRYRDLRTWISRLQEASRVTWNFHPDRLLPNGLTVARGLLSEGVVRTQFETGISNGGLTAFPGGDRDVWEEKLFGGAYHSGSIEPSERPRYAGFNVLGYLDGACPRFGSCHLRLRPDILSRCTFSFGDSASDPVDVGVEAAFEPVMVATMEPLVETGSLFGRSGLTPKMLVDRRGWTPARGRSLDGYIETQIHDAVRLAHDVEAVVIDGSFRGSEVEGDLVAAASQNGFPVEWLPALKLRAGDCPADFRGPAIPGLALLVQEEFSTGDSLDAAAIGRAARSVVLGPERWRSWETSAEALQQLKKLWHVLVAFGEER